MLNICIYMCYYCLLLFYRQLDDEYHWRQNSLGKDFYKDEINSSGQYVCIPNTLF